MTNKQLALLARIYAVNSRIEGMKAENASSNVLGYTGVYNERHFDEQARELETLAQEALADD